VKSRNSVLTFVVTNINFGTDIALTLQVSVSTSFTYPFHDQVYNYQPDFFPHFNIGTAIFSNVHRIYGNGQYYFNDSIGLIKAIIYDPDKSINTAWSLVNCKIVK
jgi:hypothetical protein